METLQSFRPALRDLALLAQAFPAEKSDLPFPIGTVPSRFFTRRIATFRLDRGQRWLDVRSLATHAYLRQTLAADLIAAGYAGAFNFGEIIGTDYRITRTIARWAYDAGYDGIAYPSTHDSSLTCWAIFDNASLTLVSSPEPIQRHDPDFLTVINLFGLVLDEAL